MHDLEVLRSGGYKGAGLTKLKLTCSLESFPPEVLDLGETLEQLDLSGTGLSSLPSNIGQSLPNLKIAFFSQCAFDIFPRELASCPQLEMVAFRGNGMISIPEGSLPPMLRWLILTDNGLTALPSSIGKCERLQKCMLAGNHLETLPEEMQNCKKLGLLRLSSNELSSLPDWLFEMPELAFLSFAGNPCSTHLADMDRKANGIADVDGVARPELAGVAWSDLKVQHTLGEGASGVISKGLWRTGPNTREEVAIKLFKGHLTSDGAPEDEMTACIAAGQHENIIDVLGRIHHHPDEEKGTFKGGLVMQLVPPHYCTLGQPPSLRTCTRDTYPADARLSFENALDILQDIAAAAQHLHERGIAHGDLYAHNILSSEEGHALLGDLGAATVHGRGISPLLEKLEVLAFAHLIEDLLGLVSAATDEQGALVQHLQSLHQRCSVKFVSARPTFDEIAFELNNISGGKTPTIPPN
ncbi:Leucine-rich repeat-containing protein 28 [Cytospora mali]|uniref:Leucine-rich repeat-containing protein 28 n=1 Tax=Cytospora mali TaxID=578113 RepID=A0A194UUR7_CYTMA|nr:Leucine-rich repeat-containing protein 28 [Valsa mali var. pyri (nom. inval.)]